MGCEISDVHTSNHAVRVSISIHDSFSISIPAVSPPMVRLCSCWPWRGSPGGPDGMLLEEPRTVRSTDPSTGRSTNRSSGQNAAGLPSPEILTELQNTVAKAMAALAPVVALSSTLSRTAAVLDHQTSRLQVALPRADRPSVLASADGNSTDVPQESPRRMQRRSMALAQRSSALARYSASNPNVSTGSLAGLVSSCSFIETPATVSTQLSSGGGEELGTCI